jgi:hypothetical protein
MYSESMEYVMRTFRCAMDRLVVSMIYYSHVFFFALSAALHDEL